MKAAGLIDIDTVVSSTAILIKSKRPSNPTLVNLIASRISGVIGMKQPPSVSPHKEVKTDICIAAQKFVLCQYNVARESLEIAKKITPGKRAPTITALEDQDWVAVSSMVAKKDIANVMDDLTKVGAKDILVLNIMNTRTD